MAQPTFPENPIEGQHFVSDNRLWVYTSYTDVDGDLAYRWVLWGNLTYVGVPGDPGVDGTEGIEGATGSTGPRGYVGPTGSSGPAGATGPKGDAGNSLRLLGNLKDFSELWGIADMPGQVRPDASEGDMYLVQDGNSVYNPAESARNAPDNNAWVYSPKGKPDGYDVAPWINVGPITGPEGEQGQAGEDGGQGPQGFTGSTGPAGLNGAHGGAFAHMVDIPPTKGPAGKIYMVKGDFAMYVTTGK